jgi:hypothetical protein
MNNTFAARVLHSPKIALSLSFSSTYCDEYSQKEVYYFFFFFEKGKYIRNRVQAVPVSKKKGTSSTIIYTSINSYQVLETKISPPPA